MRTIVSEWTPECPDLDGDTFGCRENPRFLFPPLTQSLKGARREVTQSQAEEKKVFPEPPNVSVSFQIWCFGPETEGANVVVDTTVAVQFLNEIKEHVVSAYLPELQRHCDSG